MKEKIICIVTPEGRSYFRAAPLAKEFLDKDKNIVNTIGILPEGEVEEYETSTKTVKHYRNGKLHGNLEIMDLTSGEVTFFEKYKDGVLTALEDHTIHGSPILNTPAPQPAYDGTIIKCNKATQAFYSGGKQVAEQTLAANGSSLELLGSIPDGPAKEFDDNGQTRVEAHYKNNLLDGAFIRYDEQGRLVSQENYKAGVLDGEAEYYAYCAQGFMKTIAHYTAGVLHGPWRSIFPNGESCVTTSYKQGKLHGKRKVLYITGNVDCEETYENGKLNGPRTLYFPEGQLWFKENFKNGRLDGERYSFFANGQKHLEEFYTDGLLEGRRLVYTENGLLITDEEYHFGALVHNTERRPSSALKK